MIKNKVINIFFLILLLVSGFLTSCKPINPSDKKFYKISESKPYKFDKDGSVETWDQGKEYYDISCRAKGRWRMDGDNIIVEGVFNSNCPWMEERNGRFKLNGDYLERL